MAMASLIPLEVVVFPGYDFHVLRAEMMLGVSGVLHDGQFKHARRRLGGGEMLCVPCCSRSVQFTYVVVWARITIGTSTAMGVYNPIKVKFFILSF